MIICRNIYHAQSDSSNWQILRIMIWQCTDNAQSDSSDWQFKYITVCWTTCFEQSDSSDWLLSHNDVLKYKICAIGFIRLIEIAFNMKPKCKTIAIGFIRLAVYIHHSILNHIFCAIGFIRLAFIVHNDMLKYKNVVLSWRDKCYWSIVKFKLRWLYVHNNHWLFCE